MRPVTVCPAFSPAEAQSGRFRLEAANSHPFVADEFSAPGIRGGSVATGGIRVQIHKCKVSDAVIFLNAPAE
jgi:hypothetical protein